MSSAQDGGPAFPCEQHETADGTWNQTFEPGMSLREWFAGQALAGAMACPAMRPGMKSGEYAAMAYQMADAMLAARGAPTATMRTAETAAYLRGFHEARAQAAAVSERAGANGLAGRIGREVQP